MKRMTPQKEAEVTFDECSMTDFGMYEWMRYTLLAGFAALTATAVSYRSDRRNVRSLTTPKEQQ